MNFIINGNLILPILWILIQNLLFIFMGIWVLRWWKLLKEPLSGLECSQALYGACLLFGVVIIANSSITAIYDTHLNYYQKGGEWVRWSLLSYSQYFLISLFAVSLLLCLSYLVLKIFFGFRKEGETIAGGNLPLSILMSGVVLGVTFGLSKLLEQVLQRLTPHFAIFN